MNKKLHHRPNLDHLRQQAKELLAGLAASNNDSIQCFQENLPAAKGLNSGEIQAAGYRLADAQSAIARQSGFASWPQLTHHIATLRALEGTWEFEHLEVDAEVVPSIAIQHSQLKIDGDRFCMDSAQGTYEGVFNIDVEHQLRHIDIEFIDGPEAGNWNYGIFRLDGDRLELCLDMHGQQRPDSFSTTPGSGHAYEVLRRKTKARPDQIDGGIELQAPESTSHRTPVSDDAYAYSPSATLEKLQGKWKAVRIAKDGEQLPGFMLKTAKRVAKKNEITIRVGGMKIIHALVNLDESTSPFHVNYLNIGGKAKGTEQLGIMEWRGNEAWFAMALPGEERPVDFREVPGRTISAWVMT